MNISLKLPTRFSSLRLSASNYHKFSFHEKDALDLLKQSSLAKKLAIGKLIHAHFIVTHRATEDNVIETNTLINHYSKCGHVHIARKLFDRMRHRNIVTWSALMAGYLHSGSPVEAVRLFRNMGDLRPNEYVLATIISCCSKVGFGLFKEGIICHGYAFKSGFIFHLYVKNALIYMYCMSSDVDAAWRILESVPGSDAYTYNSLINGLVEQEHVNEALRVLDMMVIENLEWDSVTYVNVFSLCSRIRNLKLGLQVHCRMVITGDFDYNTNSNSDEFIVSAIIDMYGKCGDISLARKIFDVQKTLNVVSWTSILTAYLQNGFFEEVLKLFSKMDSTRVRPNEYTIAVLLKSCAGLSVIGQGSSVHGRALKGGFADHVIVGNALINMYAKGGNIGAGRIVFVEMIYRDCKTWNAMINGYARHGLGKEALGVFEEMLAVKERPNYVTFVGVLSACGHLGWVQDGLYYYEKLMNEMGVEPGLEHHTCIVGLLSRAGLLDRALSFMRSAPVRWDVVAWRTLLNACHVHRKYDLGREVAEMVMQLDPDDVGTYILVSNMHAKAKRWDGVANIRKLMRERNIKKEPGVSWVEMKNRTYVFASDDCNHPEFAQIYEKVRELLAKIKALGYVPAVGSVLHDVEDEHKEDYLSFHSEKLAIAYALMKTPDQESAPIIVMKNLRMCDDCHSAIKLIAKVTNREIIVRDVNRFHCFQGGTCSCSDYW
ncbi:pentatricopeptide repeat-containing protein At5g39680 [Impatiens glandulifera]|uniref:pentatricopeptide repeat-containing protein At5g39680 n=1 Tax=Impatiens glandulifera TaxID=253017 RepID=UPI001FB12386|nr:pentatricopeptide repeat-containing protein At5g39680 [Impatiens glandulifera]